MIVVTKVYDRGADVLEVQGYDDSTPTEILTAHGHVSAMYNHFDSEAYVTEPITKEDQKREGGKHVVVDASPENPHLHPDAKPREMTDREKSQYWVSLLQPPQAAPVLFEDAEAVKVHQDAVAAEEAHAAEAAKVAQEKAAQEEAATQAEVPEG